MANHDQYGVPPLPSFDLNLGTNAYVNTLLGNAAVPQINTIGRNASGGLLGPMGGGTPSPDGFDWGTMQGWGQLLGGVGEIGNAYMAYKNYGLATDQFNFSKDFANRNLANQASTTNAALQQRADARNTFTGGNSNRAARVNGTAIG